MELRAAQRNNESTMQMRERDIPFQIGNEARAALKHQRARELTKHNQLVLEMPENDLFGIEWIMNNNRTISHLKKLSGLGISYTKNPITSVTIYERSEFPARLPMK